MANENRPGSYSYVAKEQSSLYPPKQTPTALVSSEGDERKQSRSKFWGAVGGSIIAIGVAATTIAHALKDAPKNESRKDALAEERERVDENIDLLRQEMQRLTDRLKGCNNCQQRQIQRMGEALCDANKGAPQTDFPCALDPHEYTTPHTPPPLRRADGRQFPSCKEACK